MHRYVRANSRTKGFTVRQLGTGLPAIYLTGVTSWSDQQLPVHLPRMLPSSGRTSLPPASMYGRCLGHMPEGPPATVTSEAPMTDDDQVPDRHWQGGSISRTCGPIIVAAISGVNFPRADVMDQPPCNTCPGSIRQPEGYKYPHNSTVKGIGTFGIA